MQLEYSLFACLGSLTRVRNVCVAGRVCLIMKLTSLCIIHVDQIVQYRFSTQVPALRSTLCGET